MTRRWLLVALSLAPALLAGCALTSKAEPVEIRYFSPEPSASAAPASPSASAPAPSAAPPGLRFGRVTSSAMLRRPIVFRRGPAELATYDDLQWTEDPEEYARRALQRALYTQRFHETVGGTGPVLEVELVAFEELRRGEARFGRVQLRYLVRDHRDVFKSATIDVERPASSAQIGAVVAALGAALEEACERLAVEVLAALPAPAAR